MEPCPTPGCVNPGLHIRPRDCAAAPERAAREGDQPLPQVGEGDVLLSLALKIGAELLERRRIGIARYGTPLQANNGRDALRDLREELLDALAYSEQEAVERAKLEQLLRDERGTCEGLEARLARIWRAVPEGIRRDSTDLENAVERLAANATASQAELAAARRELAETREALDLEVAARRSLEERLGVGGG